MKDPEMPFLPASVVTKPGIQAGDGDGDGERDGDGGSVGDDETERPLVGERDGDGVTERPLVGDCDDTSEGDSPNGWDGGGDGDGDCDGDCDGDKVRLTEKPLVGDGQAPGPAAITRTR